MIELIFVIVIIGILAATAVPKFSNVKDQAVKSTELSAASSISVALESIHGTWSMNEDDFDWDNDGVDDDIVNELSYYGYPKTLARGGSSDALSAILKSATKSGFIDQQGAKYDTNTLYRIYTAKASNPQSGVKFTTKNSSRDIEGKPDKNDFWLYVIEANATKTTSCKAVSDYSTTREVIPGDFILMDINSTLALDYTATDLGINFSLKCN
jgi:type II secretory pathway pseudopilin PulG